MIWPSSYSLKGLLSGGCNLVAELVSNEALQGSISTSSISDKHPHGNFLSEVERAVVAEV